MNLYIKQKVFSWGDQFTVYDETGNERYGVQGEVFSWGKKLHLFDLAGIECAFVHQKVFSFLPRFYISRDGVDVAEVVREFTFFHPEYTVKGLGWRVEGDLFAHEYEITDGTRTVVTVSKQWMTWGDTYEICVAPEVDEINALAVVLVIDACLDNDAN